MSLYLQASSGFLPVQKTVAPQIVRRSANYHPSIWEDYFLAFDTLHHTRTDGATKEKMTELKEEVKNMLVAAGDKPQRQMKLIDDIQRLGVAYHFKAEIDVAFNHMKDIYHELCRSKITNEDDDHNDLHNVALCFRLLRQHGHNVSSDVFKKFKDLDGKFKESLIEDVRGMLSLYEATHVRVHGEDILEEALAFTTFHLDQMKSSLPKPLSDQVAYALKVPIWKSVNRVEARRYISLDNDDTDDNYYSRDKALLSFAKLDFHMLQKLYQNELAILSRWWKDLNFKEKLPFARDRLVESYLWVLGLYFEPEYVLARSITTKVLTFLIVIDDLYDLYGTLEELVCFTNAIDRWDISAIDELPAEYLKFFYGTILDLYSGFEEEMTKAGRPLYRVQYAKDVLKQFIGANLYEAKCLNKEYVPTVEEYLPNALVSAGLIFLGTTSFVGLGDLATKEAFDWVSNDPPLVQNVALICRLTDDILEYKSGKVTSEAAAVECYMKQHGVSKEVACNELEKRIVNAWKDINAECVQQQHPQAAAAAAIPMPLVTVIFNMVRATYILYLEVHAFNKADVKTKEFITALLVDPIPL